MSSSPPVVGSITADRALSPIGLRDVALLALLVLVAYGTSLANGFVHDDTQFMTDPRVQRPQEMHRLLVEPRWGFGEPSGRPVVHQYYRPLEPLPYIVAHRFGGAAWPAHALNLLLHVASSCLALAALRRLLGSDGAAWLGAAVFATYPAYSEAVLWVAAEGGLGVVLCGLAIFALCARPEVGPWRRWWIAAGFYLAALGFKETGVTAPGFVVLYDLVRAPDAGARRLWARRWRYALFSLPLLLYLGLRPTPWVPPFRAWTTSRSRRGGW